ncbi:uncharacterized protein [Prorops nasuta]|uniref:uncharacterized protein n=1 Tax=Prorops nasuta TaxID=863751 RepID=UPI0034CE966C
MSYYLQMCELTKITIPRWNGQLSEADKLELYGFCDASNVSYSAVVYAKFTNNNSQTSVSLVMAKVKVAPLKAISIARLELVAAAYLTKLMLHIKSSLKRSIAQHSSKWKVFVANRVEYIQSSLTEAHWSYVNTKSNPADLNSRGISPSQLIHCALWWEGPSIIREKSSGNSPLMFETNEEIKTSSVYSNHVTRDLPSYLYNYSSWTKLISVVSYVLRFINRAHRKIVCQHAHLSTLELRTATLRVVKNNLSCCFLKRYIDVAKRKVSSVKFSITFSCTIFRCARSSTSRWASATLIFADKQMHPIILPTNYFTELLIRHIHITTLHGGLQLTCIACVRQRAKLGTQFMGSLPTARVNRSHPFEHTGIDYAGPFLVKLHQGRNSKSVKCYIAVFVCMAICAIHLELVSKYDTDAFLAALARFTSRCGKPAVIYFDNGMDIWSRGHSSLRWTVGERTCLNSRPLSRLRDDIESLEFLTPGHFLVGRTLLAPPEISVLDLKESSLQSHPKWQIKNNDFREGDIVIIKPPNTPPCKWNLGRIIRLIIGSDSVARVAVYMSDSQISAVLS